MICPDIQIISIMTWDWAVMVLGHAMCARTVKKCCLVSEPPAAAVATNRAPYMASNTLSL